MIQRLKQLGEFLLPTSCALCHARQAKPICTKCLQELSILKVQRCIICANPFHGWVCKSCKQNRPYFDATNCIAGDENRLFVLVKSLRSPSGLRHIPAITYAWKKLNQGQFLPVDLIIPCPWISSDIRLHGFHPRWELTKHMAKISGIASTSKLIVSNQASNPNLIPSTQTLRTQYLYKTCYLNQTLDKQMKAKLNGLRVAVVSDSMTTGATLNVVARILKENGVHWVSNWVILRTRQVEKI